MWKTLSSSFAPRSTSRTPSVSHPSRDPFEDEADDERGDVPYQQGLEGHEGYEQLQPTQEQEKQRALSWLLAAEPGDIESVLDQVAALRPDIKWPGASALEQEDYISESFQGATEEHDFAIPLARSTEPLMDPLMESERPGLEPWRPWQAVKADKSDDGSQGSDAASDVASETEPIDVRDQVCVHTRHQQLEDATSCATTKMTTEKFMAQVHTLTERKEFPGGVGLPKPEVPIVQFSSSMFYFQEGEEGAIIEVMRVGSSKLLDRRTCVAYETVDSSALAGETFEQTSGVLVFEPGDFIKHIKVPLIDDDRWNTTVEFKVVLHADERLEGGVLGKYLWTCRVKIVDNDIFPSNKYKDGILYCLGKRQWDLPGVPQVGLAFEYWKLVFQDTDVKPGSIKFLLADQLHNLYALLRLLIAAKVIDSLNEGRDSAEPAASGGQTTGEGGDIEEGAAERLLKETGQGALGLMMGMPAEKLESLLLIAAGMLIPFALLHLLDYRRYTWKVGGQASRKLQVALLRKYLNYSATCRSIVNEGELLTAVTEDAPALVKHGYVSVFALIKAVGSFMIMLAFHALTPFFLHSEFNTTAFVFTLIYPLALGITIAVRYPLTKRLLKNVHGRHLDVVHQVSETVRTYQMVADYHRRPLACDTFEGLLRFFYKGNKELNQVLLNNYYVLPWFSLVMIVLYTLVGGTEVLEGTLSMGIFVTTIHVFSEVSTACKNIYEVLVDIMKVMPELDRMVMYMNMDIDVTARRMLLNASQQHMKWAYEAIVSSKGANDDDTPVVDRMPIIIDNIRNPVHRGGNMIAQPFALRFGQGKLICLIGPHGQGKSVFLRSLGNAVLPAISASRVFFMPTHLRVLHVPNEPLVFTGSLYKNLVFGVASPAMDPDAEIGRLRRICERLTLPERVISRLSVDMESTDKNHAASHEQNSFDKDMTWYNTMSQTQKHLLVLARALVANFEVLVIHKPTELLNQKASENTLELLREYVDRRGVEQDHSQINFRRPRTCLFSTSIISRREFDIADDTFRVTAEKGIVRIMEATQQRTLSKVGQGSEASQPGKLSF